MSCCVAVPVYRDLVDPLEIVSFLRLRQIAKQDVFLVAPENLSLESYQRLWPSIRATRFEPNYFSSIAAYNTLMLSPLFYERFAKDYEWLLIHQLDAFLFHASLEKFCEMSYDYFGAPWIPGQLIRPGVRHPRLLQLLGRRIVVGNGGLSLRRLESTINLLVEKHHEIANWEINEDGFFSYWGKVSAKFRTCPLEVARHFAFEGSPMLLYNQNDGALPLGCHAFNKIELYSYAQLINPLISKMSGLLDALDGRSLPLPYRFEGNRSVDYKG